MSKSLDQTLQAAVEGDQQAWRQLIDEYSGRVYGLVLRQCGNAELAEEITQATFVKVVGKLGQYNERGRFEPWLFRIAMNRLRDEMRRRRRQASTIDFDQTPPEALGAVSNHPAPDAPLHVAEQARALHAAIARLPDADRELLHLRYTADLTFAQISEVLQEPLGTVLARGHRALKKLRVLLKESTELDR